MELINSLAEKYADTYTSPEDALLKKINEETYATHDGCTYAKWSCAGKIP